MSNQGWLPIGSLFVMLLSLSFLAYICLCLCVAAVLAPPLMASGWIDTEPQRLMARLTQFIALLCILPFLRWQRIADRAALGYAPPWPQWRRAATWGWLAGITMLLTLVIALFSLDIRVLERRLDSWQVILASAFVALLGGLLIALVEETCFRGALHTAIRRRNGPLAAMLWTALLYSLVHFMKPGALPSGMAYDAAGSAWMLAHVFIDIAQWDNLDSMVALFVAGLFLALVRERTGHIGWCVGLHAGWVLVIQVTRQVTDGNPDSELSFLVGAYDGTIGWLATAWIGALAALYWMWSSPAKRRQDSRERAK